MNNSKEEFSPKLDSEPADKKRRKNKSMTDAFIRTLKGSDRVVKLFLANGTTLTGYILDYDDYSIQLSGRDAVRQPPQAVFRRQIVSVAPQVDNDSSAVIVRSRNTTQDNRGSRS